jgi:DNA-binding GntR family transcriptional regulator
MLDNFAPSALQRADLWEMVATELRRAIISGRIGPGVHLQEPLLAQKFGVSRVPVREALARLEHEGLVRNEPRRGVFVVGFNASDVREVYDIRQFIEGYAGRLAAQLATPNDVARLRQLIEEMVGAIDAGNVEREAQADVAFHREIVQMAAHRRLFAAWEPLMGIVSTILGITSARHPNLKSTVTSHQAIVDALAAHDPEATEAALRRHLQNGERTMQEVLVEGFTPRATTAAS